MIRCFACRFPTFLLMTFRCVSTGVLQVEIACPSYVDSSSNAALLYTGPSLEAAVADCNLSYRDVFNVTLTVLTEAQNVSDMLTKEDLSAERVAHWYYNERRFPNSLSAIITPGAGGLDLTNIHQLTANWNILVFVTIGATPSEYTLTGPPILSTAYISLAAIGKVVFNVLNMHKWTTVHFIIDMTSPPMYYHTGLEILHKGDVTGSSADWSKQVVALNSMDASAIGEMLDRFQRLSRVLLFFGRANQLRRFLIEAAVRNMTNGEYVYICIEPLANIKIYGNLTWQYGDSHDEEARQAFKSLLVIHGYPLDSLVNVSTAGIELGARVRQRTREQFKIPFSVQDQSMRDVLTTYSTVAMFCQVLNESLYSNGPDSLHDGRFLSQKFLERTFTNELGDIYIDRTGNRRVTLAVSHFVGPERVREAFLVESPADNYALQETLNITDTWPGNRWPPPDKPQCGYSGDDPACQPLLSSTGFIVAIALIAIVCFGFLFLLTRAFVHGKQPTEQWWSLNADILERKLK